MRVGGHSLQRFDSSEELGPPGSTPMCPYNVSANSSSPCNTERFQVDTDLHREDGKEDSSDPLQEVGLSAGTRSCHSTECAADIHSSVPCTDRTPGLRLTGRNQQTTCSLWFCELVWFCSHPALICINQTVPGRRDESCRYCKAYPSCPSLPPRRASKQAAESACSCQCRSLFDTNTFPSRSPCHSTWWWRRPFWNRSSWHCNNYRTFRIAWWMGAAPLYFGRREGCILSPPSLKHEITWGGMKKPNEATTHSWNCLDKMDSGGRHSRSVCWLEGKQIKRRVRHYRNLRKGNIILATEVLDWRFNELTSMLALLIGGTYNLGS